VAFAKNKLGIPTERIRTCVAEALAAAVKAYNLRAVTTRLGLADGSDEEAFRSKRLYVLNRIGDRKEQDLLRLAQSVTDEFEAPALTDLLSELTTHSDRRLSTVTRREILKVADSLGTLFGEHPNGLYECLDVIAPRWEQMFDPARPLCSLRDGVHQHYLRNPEDWSHADLLQHCGALECSQARFFNLIAALLHPLARRGEEQKQLVAQLDALLRADGFTLSITGYESTHAIYEVQRLASGVVGSPKNLIFASIGEKPEIVLTDAINNDVRITRHEWE
jgi:AbiJ-like protein